MKFRSMATLAFGAMVISSCSSVDDRPTRVATPQSRAVADYPVKLGEPYQLDGQTYTPADVLNYDEVGYASWYGAEFEGRPTANGELFDPDYISGAHRTLPLPSYVEVTALDTGRTILLRLNDRGPASSNRLIDMSYGAAQQLGITERGVAAVRVRRVNPPEQERLMLREGKTAAARLETPPTLLTVLQRKLGDAPVPNAVAGRIAPSQAPIQSAASAPNAPATGYIPSAPIAQTDRKDDGRFIIEGESQKAAPSTARPAPSTERPKPNVVENSYVVQVAAFSSKSRADALAAKIGARVERSDNGSVWRVRYGPYSNRDAAQQGLLKAKNNGYSNATILSGSVD